MSSTRAWPEAELDTVMRLRILAAALPDCQIEETIIDAPFDAVWSIAGDLEGGVPRFEGNVTAIDILGRREGRIDLVAHGRFGTRFRYQAELRPGWCLMRSRFTDIGMAASAIDEHTTRFAHFEGAPGIGRFLRPLIRRSVRSDLERLAAIVAEARR